MGLGWQKLTIRARPPKSMNREFGATMKSEGATLEVLFNPEERLVRLIWSVQAGMHSQTIQFRADDALRLGRDLLGDARTAEDTFSFRLRGMPEVTMPAEDAVVFLEKFVRAAETARGGLN
jgi:hypothetical protein